MEGVLLDKSISAFQESFTVGWKMGSDAMLRSSGGLICDNVNLQPTRPCSTRRTDMHRPARSPIVGESTIALANYFLWLWVVVT